MYYIYIIIDENLNTVYVGRTQDPHIRRLAHIQKKIIKGEFCVIDEFEGDMILSMEKYYINQFKQWGFILLNKRHLKAYPLKFKKESYSPYTSKEMKFTETMKAMQVGQVFVTDLKNYESLQTIAGRLKRNGVGKFTVSLKNGNTTVTKKS